MDLTIYYSDLMDHMNKICETLDEIKEVVEIFKDADFILSSYRANRGIRAIAAMLVVLLCASVVFGLYASYTLSSGSPQIFFLLLAIVLVIIGIVLFIFHRRRVI